MLAIQVQVLFCIQVRGIISIHLREKSLLNNLSAVMELMPPNIIGIERRIRTSACIVVFQTEVTPE